MKLIYILRKGLMFCIPSAIFFAFASYGRGGDLGGAIALILGLIIVLLGLPWNVILVIAWSMLAEVLDYPTWLIPGTMLWIGHTKDVWIFFPGILFMSTPGAFINGLIVGWITAKRESRHDV